MIEPAHPLRLLCADDNHYVLDMLEKTFTADGHAVEVATNGRAAVARIQQQPDFFEVIITDTKMPGLDGFGVVKEARSAGYKGKIIVFANALSARDRERYDQLQVDRVIDKPAKTGELRSAVRELRAGLG